MPLSWNEIRHRVIHARNCLQADCRLRWLELAAAGLLGVSKRLRECAQPGRARPTQAFGNPGWDGDSDQVFHTEGLYH